VQSEHVRERRLTESRNDIAHSKLYISLVTPVLNAVSCHIAYKDGLATHGVSYDGKNKGACDVKLGLGCIGLKRLQSP